MYLPRARKSCSRLRYATLCYAMLCYAGGCCAVVFECRGGHGRLLSTRLAAGTKGTGASAAAGARKGRSRTPQSSTAYAESATSSRRSTASHTHSPRTRRSRRVHHLCRHAWSPWHRCTVISTKIDVTAKIFAPPRPKKTNFASDCTACSFTRPCSRPEDVNARMPPLPSRMLWFYLILLRACSEADTRRCGAGRADWSPASRILFVFRQYSVGGCFP